MSMYLSYPLITTAIAYNVQTRPVTATYYLALSLVCAFLFVIRVMQKPSSYTGVIFSLVCVFWIAYLLRVVYEHAFTDIDGHQREILYFALGGALIPFLAFWKSGLSIANRHYQTVGINWGLLSLSVVFFFN